MKSILTGEASETEKEKAKEPVLSGKLAMSTERAHVAFSNVFVENEETGETIHIPDFTLSPENKKRQLADLSWENYIVSFEFCRTEENQSGDLGGRYSFGLEYAKQDEDNKLCWEIASWGRVTNLWGMTGGDRCDFDAHLAPIGNGRLYRAKLTVKGAEAETSIDGRVFCHHKFRTVQPEKLYDSAVKDQDGSVIVKLANVLEESRKIEIRIPDKTFSGAEIHEMSGYELTDKNSFEKPEKVSPKVSRMEISDGVLQYELPGYSFAVMKFCGLA